MKHLVLGLFCLVLCASGFAQSTTVTLQVTDTASQTWNNGTYSAVLTPPPGAGPVQFLLGGTVMTPGQITVSGSLNATGGASFSLTPNASITPVNTTWTITVCPQATASCFKAGASISGATQSVTITPPPIVVTLANPPYSATAYADSEVTGVVVGSSYYNLVSNNRRVCTIVSGSNCNTWAADGGGYIGGTQQSVWKDNAGIIIPYVATDSETMEESTWLYEASCQVLTALPKCWKVWHSAGWTTTGMSYAECTSLPNGAPGLCTRLNAGALFTSVGTGASGARSRGYVLHQGATYYMFICGANCTTIDMWSSSTGGNDFVLVQAAILSIGGVGAWDHTLIYNPMVWVEGTTWKIVYGGNLSSVYGIGYAQCTSACTGGSATFTKSGSNPIIGPDAVNLGGYGNPDLHIVNGAYWIWGHSTGATASNGLPSDIYRWNCGAAGVANAPTTCTQNPLGVPTFGRQTSDEGASTTVGQVADVNIFERTDLGKTFIFFEGDLDGTQVGGMEHLKYNIAEMPLAALVTTSEGRSITPDNLSLNSLAVAVHSPPGLGMISVGNSNSAVAFRANNPTCSLIYMAQTNADASGLFCNEFLTSGSPATLSNINTALTAGRFQYNVAAANNFGGFILGNKNIAGVETYPLQGYFDSSGNSYDILPLHSATGTAPVITGTGACATGSVSAKLGTWAGTFTCGGTTGASTVTLTWPTGVATNGWVCQPQNGTTPANVLQQTGHTATTCVLTAASVTLGNVFVYTAFGF